MRIYKYSFTSPSIYLPIGASILDVQVQDDILCLWAAVDENEKDTDLAAAAIGTGFECGVYVQQMKYMKTLQMFNGKLVLHVFVFNHFMLNPIP